MTIQDFADVIVWLAGLCAVLAMFWLVGRMYLQLQALSIANAKKRIDAIRVQRERGRLLIFDGRRHGITASHYEVALDFEDTPATAGTPDAGIWPFITGATGGNAKRLGKLSIKVYGDAATRIVPAAEAGVGGTLWQDAVDWLKANHNVTASKSGTVSARPLGELLSAIELAEAITALPSRVPATN